MGHLRLVAGTVDAGTHDASTVHTHDEQGAPMLATRTLAVITTADGLPGFPNARHWAIEEHHEDSVFSLMRAADTPGVALVVAEPWLLAPGYEPDLPEAELALVGITEPADLTLRVVVGIDAGRRLAWLNLAAPIVINVHTGAGRQVILDRQGWPLRHPVTLEG
jgi:flagellar assembly factor FliW